MRYGQVKGRSEIADGLIKLKNIFIYNHFGY